MVSGKLDICMQKNEAGPLPHTIHKINSKCIIGLNVKPKPIKILEQNTGGNFLI